jgi:hypothetical protein
MRNYFLKFSDPTAPINTSWHVQHLFYTILPYCTIVLIPTILSCFPLLSELSSRYVSSWSIVRISLWSTNVIVTIIFFAAFLNSLKSRYALLCVSIWPTIFKILCPLWVRPNSLQALLKNSHLSISPVPSLSKVSKTFSS